MNKHLIDFKNRIIKNEPFALIRFGDGEKNIIDNVACNRKGFKFDPKNKEAKKFRQQLIASLEYDGGKNYLLGINPPELILRAKSPVVSANLFVNQHYIDFLKKVVPIFKTKPIYLICNRKASPKILPFIPQQTYKIHNNAWEHDIYKYIIKILRELDPKLVLIAGGVYACTLIHRLWQKIQKHTLIDIGSVFDPFLYKQLTRQYHERILKNVIESL